jgi:hypothetical protein
MRPLVLGFVRVVSGPAAAEIELTGRMAGWAHREGYALGVTYREQDGNGAFESLLQAIKRHGAAGVVVPSFEHLAPCPETRVRELRERAGVSVYATAPTSDRSAKGPIRHEVSG